MAKGKAKLASRKNKAGFVPPSKDDGTRWLVMRHGRAVYPTTGGTPRAEAERLAAGLLEPAELIQINIT